MNFCGVICEFNPLHNGHEYLIKEAKKQTGCDIVCLMSGNFVQRGEPAFVGKYERAKNAISAGATAVLELPTIYACSNAENFAYGAVKILDALGADTLAFGVENADLELLEKIAKLKAENSASFTEAFKNEIENGICYNTALKRAIAKEFGNDKILEILEKPNNILAVEYLTAIIKLDSKIKPVAIKRIDNGYYSENEKNEFLSASGIRKLVLQEKEYEKYIPEYVKFDKYFDKICSFRFESLIIWNLRKMTPETLEKHYDYNEGIEYRIKEMANKYSTLDEIIDAIVTPRYRESRIKKLLIYPSLEITKKKVSLAKTTKPAVKVLAIAKSNKALLSSANKRKISLVVSNKDYENLTKQQKQIFDIDLNASNLYGVATQTQNNDDKKKGTLFV